MKSQRLAIGVFGHYGNKNLGDESIIEAVIQNIRKRVPLAIIYGFSIVPEDTLERHDIESFPIRRRIKASKLEKTPTLSDFPPNKEEVFYPNTTLKLKAKAFIKKIPLLVQLTKFFLYLLQKLNDLGQELIFLKVSYTRLKKLDILMITGSNQFLDNFGGPWGFPYTLLKWSVIAKLANTKVYFVSVGAGPISHKFSKFLIRRTLKFADYVSLRDVSSENLIHKIGCTKQTFIYPDIAHSLNIEHIIASPLPSKVSANTKPIIGINPMPLYDPRYWCEKDDNRYNIYVSKLADFCSRLMTEDYPFYFFATQEKDNNVIKDVMKKLEEEHNRIFAFDDYTLTSKSVDELMANIAAADITIATRFHGTVLSLLSEKPMLGICYYRKARELLVDMGQEDYTVELDNFTVEELWTKFTKLIDNLAKAKSMIQKKNERYASELNSQYDKLFMKTAV